MSVGPDSGTATIESVIRALRLLDRLWDSFAEGLTPSEIAKVGGESPSYVTRAMVTLEDAGWVEREPVTGRWRPSVRIARRARKVAASIDVAEARLGELRNRAETPL